MSRPANLPLLRIIIRRLTKFSNVEILWNHEVVDLSQDKSGVTLSLHKMGTDEGSQVRAEYCVGADGGRSKVRKLIGQYAKTLSLCSLLT